jgi:hypothetical protein
MSFNGSGTFVPPAGQPVVTGTVIQSSTFNALVADIGNTFNNVMPRDGQASMAGQLKLIDGTSSIPGIAFNSEASSGIYRPSAGMMALVASGVEAMRMNSAGRIMIGSTVDDGTNKLQVNGPAKITGALVITGASTALSYTGPLIGNVTGNVSGSAGSVTGVVPIATGGTGATSAAGALTALGAASIASVPLASSTAPAMNGTGAVGSSGTFSRSDHVHPADTSRAPIANPTFSGVVTAPSFSGSLSGNATNVVGIVSVTNGGTGASTAAVARSTLGVPATDGTGSTGTWPVSISGTAATATTLSALANYAYTAAHTPGAFPAGVQSFFVQGSDGFPNYGSVLNIKTYADGGGSMQLYAPYSPTIGGTNLRFRCGNYDVNSGNSWTAWKSLLSEDGGSVNGNLVFGNNTGLFFKDTGGTAHQTFVYASDNNLYVNMPTGGYYNFMSVGGALIARLDNNGNFSANVITQSSDETKKENWRTVEPNFLQKLAAIKNVGMFDWIESKKTSLGIGAQSLEKVLPAAVHTDDKGDKTVNYGGAAIVSVVELTKLVFKLEARIAELEGAR